MAVVCDTSPVIFLAKLDLLDLIPRLFRVPVLVPVAVQTELLTPHIDPAEKMKLEKFLSTCEIVPVKKPPRFSTSLSIADCCALALALGRGFPLLADDGLLRRFAVMHKAAVIGTIGVLLQAVRRDILTPRDARVKVDSLLSEHQFRMRVEVYQQVLAKIGEYRKGRADQGI